MFLLSEPGYFFVQICNHYSQGVFYICEKYHILQATFF